MTVEELEKAVSMLAPDQLAKFRTWFEAFDAARFDDKIQRDAVNGKLDGFAEEAIGEHKRGQTRNL
ncbi:MAG: hypothetical protein K2P86_03755 [Xanthobacteraceae bacterium]|nr:hypothetical protein [Xanthobacteraceae bacterium]